MAAQKSLNEDYKSDGKWKEIWRRFKKNKGAVIGLVLLVVLTVILVGAPLFISYDKAITQNMDLMLAKPSVGNLFGNDGYGRDIFARIIYGGRVSIAIAILATAREKYPLRYQPLRFFLHTSRTHHHRFAQQCPNHV